MNFENGEWDKPDTEDVPDSSISVVIGGMAAVAVIVLLAALYIFGG